MYKLKKILIIDDNPEQLKATVLKYVVPLDEYELVFITPKDAEKLEEFDDMFVFADITHELRTELFKKSTAFKEFLEKEAIKPEPVGVNKYFPKV